MKAALILIVITLVGIACLELSLRDVEDQLGQPLVGYSDTTWTIGDTLVWKHGADTLKLDMSKFK